MIHEIKFLTSAEKFEVIAVVLTGVGKLIFMDLLHWKLLFIVVTIISWSAYVIYQSSKVNHLLKYWGFRLDNFKEVTLRILPFGIVSIASFFVVGYLRGTLNISWHIIPILILYPIWGAIQQFLVIGLVAGNLQDLEESKLNHLVIILITALLFSIVHYPFLWLMLGTFVLALLYGFIYLRARNIYVMGLFHGWLGGLFFYTVVNRDPFSEVFGKFLE